MNRIILGLGMIAVVAGLGIGASGAFFSDTESSLGNTFTAGALDLRVDSEAHYNGLICRNIGTSVPDYRWLEPLPGPATPQQQALDHYNEPCEGSWEESDLIGEGVFWRFFNLDDVKPGDEGENTISLHVYNNDAWGCFLVDNVQNADNTCTEPEDGEAAEGCTQQVQEGPVNGELGANITFDAWLDEGAIPGFQNIDANGDPVDADSEEDGVQKPDPTEGDNVFQVETEGPLFWDDESVDEASEGPFDIRNVLAAAYSLNQCSVVNGDTDYGSCHGLAQDGRMVGSTTYYFGLAWNVPDSVGNIIQTDSLVSDLHFEVAQHRNNEDFTCTPREEETGPTTLTLEKSINQDQTNPVTEALWTLTASSTDTTTLISGIESDSSVSSAPVLPGTYVLTESSVAGFSQTGLVCGGNATPLAGNVLTIAAGEQVVCTFTNTELPT